MAESHDPIIALRQTRDMLRAFASSLVQSNRGAGRFGQQFFDRNTGQPKRDLLKELGYKEKLEFADYWAKYDRGDLAARIIDAPAKATWRKAPLLIDGGGEPDDPDKKTPFEAAWEELIRVDHMNVGHYLERADRLAGIGRFGILLIGVRDGQELDQPVEAGRLAQGDLLYLAAYSEGSVQVAELDTDTQSPRFGKPAMYEVDLSGDLAETMAKGRSARRTWTKVHHSRVIHIAEDLLEDEVYGRPRLKRVFNRLDDLLKIVGGSAEMFWQGAFTPVLFHTQKDYRVAEESAEDIEAEIQDLIHQLKRWAFLEGVEAQTLNTSAQDPTAHFNVQIDLIAAATGIPKRILLGSERGELASSQDERNWRVQIADRQSDFAESQILRPFVNRLIEWGVLPAPTGGTYTVEWPPQDEPSSDERAAIAEKAAGVGERLSRTLGLSDEEVRFVVKEVLQFAGIDLGEVEPSDSDEGGESPVGSPASDEEQEEEARQFAAMRRRAG